LESDNYLWRLDRGYFYLDTGDSESALLDAHAAINLAPQEPMAYGLRAGVKNSLGDAEGAIADLDAALALGPSPEGLAEIELTRSAILAGTANGE
jgi:Tfp pilus assembly protein PilF